MNKHKNPSCTLKRITHIIDAVILILFSGCTTGQINMDALHTINIASSMNNMQKINLSQFTENIKYVPLETFNDMVFTGIWDCAFSDSLLIAKDLEKCLLYNYEGKYILKIGNRGRGPGEYQYSMNTVFGPNKNIFIQSLYDLFEYKMDGSFSEKYKNIFLFKDDFIASWLPIQDSLIFAKVASSTGKEKYKALIFNKRGDVKYYFKNYIHFNRKKPLASDDEQYANIYKFQNNIYFKEVYNDTLFRLSNLYQLLPEFVITLGNFSKPLSVREDISMEAMNKMGDFMSVTNVLQTSNYILINCFFSNWFPAKRLTQKKPPIPIPNPEKYGWYNTKSALGIFNKQTKSLIFCEPTSTDNPLFTSGLYNDIDAGPRFFPKKQVNDSTMVMWMDAKQLKDHVASDDFKNNVPKYPEKKKQLYEFANRLTEFDNAVLMFVTFKK